MEARGSTSEYLWRQLTAAELRARFDSGAIALWPVGATEQHGPHLATGFDHLAAEAVVHAAAAKLAPAAVVLPTLSIGCSRHWLALGGTLSLSAETMLRVIADVCSSAQEAGVRRLIMVNGHMGNVGVGLTALGDLVGAELQLEFVCYWDLVDRELLAERMATDISVGHAGEFETSIGLHLGGLVHEDRIPPRPSGGPAGPAFGGSAIHRSVSVQRDTVGGVVGSAAAATAELGAVIVEAAVDALVAHCRAVSQ